MDDKKKIRAKVYFNEKSFALVAGDAEKAGKRRGGLQLFTQKEHGFAHERVANTDGVSKFLKFTWQYWREHESDRLLQAAELARQEKELFEKKKKLGV